MNLKGQVNSNICCQVSCPDLGLVTVVMHRITYATALKAFPSMNARDRSVQCLSLLMPYPNAVIPVVPHKAVAEVSRIGDV